jgi:hypothetical protein
LERVSSPAGWLHEWAAAFGLQPSVVRLLVSATDTSWLSALVYTQRDMGFKKTTSFLQKNFEKFKKLIF